MKKLYEKDPVWFAVLWIGIYVLAFGNADTLSEAIGIPKLLTVVVGILLSFLLWHFLRSHRLTEAYGLCRFQGKPRDFLYFLPLIAISSVNFWNGLTLQEAPLTIFLYILSMCCVAFLEEVIFRGLLFRGLCKENITVAIWVSSLTFGFGHIVNLFFGEPVLPTIMQLVYASAIGFCYTAIVYTGGSLLPCILSHAFVNTTSIFAREPDLPHLILTTALQALLGFGYGMWLLRKAKKRDLTSEKNEL